MAWLYSMIGVRTGKREGDFGKVHRLVAAMSNGSSEIQEVLAQFVVPDVEVHWAICVRTEPEYCKIDAFPAFPNKRRAQK